MAVQLSFDVCMSPDCKLLSFTEETGVYDATNNIGGWGTPNEATTDATNATLTITDTDDVSTVLTLYSQFPSSTDTVSRNINMDDIGGAIGDKFPDGLYTFLYTVTTATTTYTQTIKKLFFCQAACCVSQLFADITDEDCDCQEEAEDKALKAFTVLQALKYNAHCGKEDRFDNLLTILDKLCNSEDCSSC